MLFRSPVGSADSPHRGFWCPGATIGGCARVGRVCVGHPGDAGAPGAVWPVRKRVRFDCRRLPAGGPGVAGRREVAAGNGGWRVPETTGGAGHVLPPFAGCPGGSAITITYGLVGDITLHEFQAA